MQHFENRFSKTTTGYHFGSKGLVDSVTHQAAREYYQYNKRGLLVQETYTTNEGITIQKKIIKYNEHNDIIEESTGPANIYRYEYVYDRKGNWTERKTYLLDDITTIIKRQITYH